MNSINTKTDFLSVEQLSWRVQTHQSNTEICILDNINFSVKLGEFVGVVGPNGAGKSSLLRCLYGKVFPSSGQVYFNQRQLSHYSRKQLANIIAVVLQEPPTQFELSVRDVISMGLIPSKKLLSFDTLLDQQAIASAASKVDLFSKLHHDFNSLSGGEKQRAMIARAILQKPQLLIMDEPTNHLDVRHQIDVLQLAASLGITVIVSIHDLNLAATYCDRLILMDKGKIVAEGKPGQVLTEQALKQVFSVNAAINTHPDSQKTQITFDLTDRAGKKQIENSPNNLNNLNSKALGEP